MKKELIPFSYEWRKEQRRIAYEKKNGKKLVTCVACNGSGRYDHNGAPECSSCGGTGKHREN